MEECDLLKNDVDIELKELIEKFDLFDKDFNDGNGSEFVLQKKEYGKWIVFLSSKVTAKIEIPMCDIQKSGPYIRQNSKYMNLRDHVRNKKYICQIEKIDKNWNLLNLCGCFTKDETIYELHVYKKRSNQIKK